MTDLEKEVERILVEREKASLLSRLQKTAESNGAIPPSPSLLLRRNLPMLELIGGVTLGLFTAIIALWLNFLVFVWFLHFEF